MNVELAPDFTRLPPARKELDEALESLKDLDLTEDIHVEDLTSKVSAYGSTSDVFQIWSPKYGRNVAVKRIRISLYDQSKKYKVNIAQQSFHM